MNDDDEKFWVNMWRIFGIVFVITILSISGCLVKINQDDNNAMQAMIKDGATAEQASCAVKGEYILCQIIAAKR